MAASALALLLGAALWLPILGWLHRPALLPASRGVTPQARALVAEQLATWTDPARRTAAIARMRAANAEWDFMGRTFLVLALCNLAERDPDERARCLEAVDAILAATLALEAERGHTVFLLPYGSQGRFRYQPPDDPTRRQSLFVDGEIALMLAARRLVAERADYQALLAERVARIEHQLQAGPLLCGESYPDECWLFCNAAALAALRLSDALEGSDHRPLCAAWVRRAKERLVHAQTGLLVSSFTLEGKVRDGPEGSSIFMAAHCLRLVDPELARDQYLRARAELARGALGFAWARECPASWTGPRDIDSGPVVPLLEASPSASGLALLGAASFGDRELLAGLMASLELGAVPLREGGRLRYAASNQVGDAVMLLALLQGPLWEKAGAPAEEVQ
ncbi:MAG TPA: hypothetical protein DEA08_33230 [Planctomycetes bacterium]|nr:hypothetical protein [Planctomycetota bacterium]